MTNEEAIRIIKIVLAIAEDFEITVQGEEFTEEKCKEAVEIVTKALEQQPCEDAISRQALIEKATSWDKHFGDSERCVSLTDIQNAPSVTPKQPFINKPCISEGVCHEDKINVLKKIRTEIIELRTRQNVGVMECLDIIDEYIVESEEE